MISNERTQVLSVIDNIRGAYGEFGIDIVCEGEPRPDMPETLCRLLLEGAATEERLFGGAPSFWRFEDEFEFESVGGVLEPLPKEELIVEDDCVVGTELAVSLFTLESVLFSFWNEDFDFLRISLKKVGAMAG